MNYLSDVAYMIYELSYNVKHCFPVLYRCAWERAPLRGKLQKVVCHCYIIRLMFNVLTYIANLKKVIRQLLYHSIYLTKHIPLNKTFKCTERNGKGYRYEFSVVGNFNVKNHFN